MKHLRAVASAVSSIAILLLSNTRATASATAPNFSLLDCDGKSHELHRASGRAVVLFFTGNGCPVARKSAGKLLELKKQFGDEVSVWLVNSELGVDGASVKKETDELGLTGFPVLLDTRQALAQTLGVQRTAETVIIDTRGWSILYRGALDDQLSEGAEKPQPAQRYAELALTAHLKGETIPVPSAPARGCLLTFEENKPSDEPVDFARQVAPILEARCVSCHRSGDIGPFAFSSYQTAKRKSRMIEEVILTQRMPPWHADPHFGKFANATALTTAETQTLLRWIRQGAPPSAGEDPLARQVPEPAEWPLGAPDYIIKLPHPEEVPATGVLDYRHVLMDSPIHEDVWLTAAVVKPGNRKVLHHMIAYAKFEGSGNDPGANGVKIAGWAPGRLPGRLPDDTALFLGKDAKLDIELHYTTVGTPETDQTEIGLYVQHEKPRYIYKTGMAIQLNLKIPPHAPEAVHSATFTLGKDSLLFALIPHMHRRGSWMKYEALYPDGRRETLLSVPHFDFNWQTSYRLAEPLRVPAGTKILCSGAFDNSPGNPSNPDPEKEIRWGQQSWDEMFIGYVGYAEVPRDAAKTE